MNWLKRLTICKLANHKWAKVNYPAIDPDEPTGMLLRCLRCGKEDHSARTVGRGAGGLY